MDLTTILFFVAVGWVVWKISNAVSLTNAMDRLRVLEHLNSIIHEVKVETHDTVEYWFDNGDDTFLAQGKTLEEIINHLKARFPDHVFILPEKGGIAKQTDWKLVGFDEFKKIKFEGEISV
jgi:hypothetical protein